MSTVKMTHGHLFCSSGGAGIGFNMANPRVGQLQGVWECIGGIDVDPGRCRDFRHFTGAPATVIDLFSRAQYVAHNGHEPPAGWREALPEDIRRAFGGRHPTAVVTSPPCRGFSGLLSAALSQTAKYQALNELTLRGLWLLLEAYADDPVPFIVLENVPFLMHRGRDLLNQIVQLQRRFGYATAETVHDCGEIGGLAQSRRRFLLMARHTDKIPPFLYEPDRKPLRAVGDVLGRMLLPGDLRAGPMHRVPNLQWKTWTRLAMVAAGSDWRSLNRLAVVDGKLRDYLIVPEGWRPDVPGAELPSPRNAERQRRGPLGVVPWDASAATIAGENRATNSAFNVADPGFQGAFAAADPRPPQQANLFATYPVCAREGRGTAIGGDNAGAYAVADPRPGMRKEVGDSYLTAGHYGVVPWTASSGAVPASACHDNGAWSVADPRGSAHDVATGACIPLLPAPTDKLVARIVSEDGTWHRPLRNTLTVSDVLPVLSALADAQLRRAWIIAIVATGCGFRRASARADGMKILPIHRRASTRSLCLDRPHP